MRELTWRAMMGWSTATLLCLLDTIVGAFDRTPTDVFIGACLTLAAASQVAAAYRAGLKRLGSEP